MLVEYPRGDVGGREVRASMVDIDTLGVLWSFEELRLCA